MLKKKQKERAIDMARVFMFFCAERAYKRFILPYIGSAYGVYEDDYLKFKELKRFHTFTSAGLYGNESPTENGDWCIYFLNFYYIINMLF